MVSPMEMVKLSNSINTQIRYVTCPQCCKYYIAPETATCGHSLCHTCWTYKKYCPLCTRPIDRKKLKFNKVLKIRTEHIHALNNSFAEHFNIKLDEFVLKKNESEEIGKIKNVRDWLTNSDNHFSVAPSSETTVLPCETTKKAIVTEVQVHSNNTKTAGPVKKTFKAMSQHDFDVIEEMPDDENEKQQENVIGPKDFEPFNFDEKEYSSEHPRRSSRKRKAKNMDIENEKSIDDVENIDTNIANTNLKVHNIKECWNYVKRMRKDLDKPNKNSSKLNVSVGYVKNAKDVTTKCTSMTAKPLIQTFHTQKDDNKQHKQITENLSRSCVLTDSNQQNVVKQSFAENKSTNEKGILTSPKDISEKKPGVKDDKEKDVSIEKTESLAENKSTNEKVTLTSPKEISQKNPSVKDDKEKDVSIEKTDDIENSLKDHSSNKGSTTAKIISQETTIRMPFIKKSALCPKQEVNNAKNKVIEEVNNPQTIDKDSYDIEISIKIGNTIANINIKRKENDIHFKVVSDQSVQTSQLQESKNKPEAEFTLKNITGQNIDLNLGNNPQEIIQITSRNTINSNDINSKPDIESTSTKKHTSSAATQTVDVIITDSLEKELANSMGCNKNLLEKEVSTKENIMEKDDLVHPVNAELPHDVDIFDTESIKETEVCVLKHAPSEILMTSVGSRKFKDKSLSKRKERVVEDISDSNKKQKIDSEIELELNKNNIIDSDSIHYDSLMSQVFAKIDDDIRNNPKTKTQSKDVNEIHNKIANSQKTQHSNLNHIVDNNKKNIINEHIAPSSGMANQNSADPHNLEIALSVHCIGELTPSTGKSKRQRSQNTNRRASVENRLMQDNDDSDRSVVEETPEKNISFTRIKQNSDAKNRESKEAKIISVTENKSMDKENVKSVITLEDSTIKSGQATVIDKTLQKDSLETPMSIDKFVGSITYKSTPVARKSLNFDGDIIDDLELTVCPTANVAKNTQEKEFMMKEFECTPVKGKFVSLKVKKYCIAGSCLNVAELANLRTLCKEHNWRYVDKYTKDLTHLVVSVNDENRSQRSVKYMCALAASKWIISYAWVEKCLKEKRVLNVESFEALDSTGALGPMRSRTAKNKLFTGFKFFCMQPFTVLDVKTLSDILEASGGQVVNSMEEVRVTGNTHEPALLLAEPENTQEDQFIYLAMEHSIVPVNYEWVLNCLGSYSLDCINDLLLCPSSLLPPATSNWPNGLIAPEISLI